MAFNDIVYPISTESIYNRMLRHNTATFELWWRWNYRHTHTHTHSPYTQSITQWLHEPSVLKSNIVRVYCAHFHHKHHKYAASYAFITAFGHCSQSKLICFTIIMLFFSANDKIFINSSPFLYILYRELV